ncbi:MAG TPA: hypothetical protein VKN82_10030 [Desulfohalobiaceae bacterium]|nr:hypothetical protein [Desulfohalobiaceae bacterium]
MDITITDTDQTPPVDRGYALSIVITTFRGHEDVEVHLFRPNWQEEELAVYDWQQILGDPIRKDREIDPTGSRKVLVETFNSSEKDIILEYLENRYASRLKSIKVSVIPFPIPMGLVPLSEIPQQKNIGLIRFDEIPNYPLNFPFHGIYDLSRHNQSASSEQEPFI